MAEYFLPLRWRFPSFRQEISFVVYREPQETFGLKSITSRLSRLHTTELLVKLDLAQSAASQARLDHQDPLASQADQEIQEHQETQDSQADQTMKPAYQLFHHHAHRAQLEHQANKEDRERQEKMEHQAHKDTQDKMEHQELQDKRDLQAQLDPLEDQDQWVRQAAMQKTHQLCQAQLDLLVNLFFSLKTDAATELKFFERNNTVPTFA